MSKEELIEVTRMLLKEVRTEQPSLNDLYSGLSSLSDILDEFTLTTPLLNKLKLHRILAKVLQIGQREDNEEVIGLARRLMSGWLPLISKAAAPKKKSTARKVEQLNVDISAPVIPPIDAFEDERRTRLTERLMASMQIGLENYSYNKRLLRDHAVALEYAIYEMYSTDMKSFRICFQNIADCLRTNTPLLIRLLTDDHMDHQQLVDLDIELLIPEHIAQERMKQRQHMMESSVTRETSQGATTHSFCGKCGMNVLAQIVAMKQLRSADEPMTMFLKCSKCGNRFKR
ncbi:hypothetical protein PCE1_002752 [Barthelona sp. PCE]